MTTATKTDRQIQIASLDTRIRELADRWVVIGHNSGTYGAVECCRYTGTGQPEAGYYEVLQHVGNGRKRHTDDPDNMPGYTRWSKAELTDCQRELAELRRQRAALSR